MSASMLPDILLGVFLPLLLAASAFFSASETALFSLTGHQRHLLARQKTLSAQAVIRLLDETRALLITLLMGNMLVNTAYFVITTVLLFRLNTLYHVWATLAGVMSVACLLALILLGELMPKLLAARSSYRLALLIGVPLWVAHRTIGPFRLAVEAVVIEPLARLIAPEARPPGLSTEELAHLLEVSQNRGVIDPGEEDLLQGVLNLSQLQVRDIMRPRVDIVAFDLRRPPEKLLELLRARRLSRIPVYRGDLDHIQGVVYTRQVLLRKPRTARQLQALVRQVTFVPEIQRADQLLVQFRKRGTTLAIAVDEYGGTAGLVTLKDVVEQMVGRIASHDESMERAGMKLLAPGVWRVSAGLSVDDLLDTFGGGTKEEIEAVTIGGLVMSRLGRLPRVGDRLQVGSMTLEVEKMRGWRIDALLMRMAGGHGVAGSGERGGQP
ncbi:MAG: HlyC/CorC family transporter [Phycisphaeraceae bacterium]|nr:HlyC/CorC family transporter [Phycisphaeraceae bacterium]